jgi:SHS2 domain-containing protein
MAWRTFEHTADVGIEVEAGDLPGLFAEAAVAFRELVIGAAGLEPTEDRIEVDVRADDLAALLLSFLEELLYRWDAHGVMVVDLAVELDGEGRVRAHGRRATARPEAEVHTEVKAVTWHGLSVEPAADGGWRGRFILDI